MSTILPYVYLNVIFGRIVVLGTLQKRCIAYIYLRVKNLFHHLHIKLYIDARNWERARKGNSNEYRYVTIPVGCSAIRCATWMADSKPHQAWSAAVLGGSLHPERGHHSLHKWSG